MKVDDLIDFFGNQAKAALALGVTQPSISNWRKRGRIPHLQQLRAEHFTEGKLKADSTILGRKKSRANRPQTTQL